MESNGNKNLVAMKRLFLLLTFIGALFVVPKGFTQSTKSKQVTLKYEDGSKYIGTILIQKVNGKKKKYKDGDGIMYYANGNRFEGTWKSDLSAYGTYYYANANRFEGYLKDNVPFKGEFVFAN